jgi:hypothetical protein
MQRTTSIPVAFAGAALCAGVLVLGLATAPVGAEAQAACTSTRLTDVSDGSFVDDLDLSGDGQTVAFSSPADLGSGGGNREVYLADTTTGAISPVTVVAGSTLDSTDPALDFDASHITFLSEAPIWVPNADGNAEVLRAERASASAAWTFGNVTNGTTGDTNRSPVIDDDGSTIAYQSRRTDVANADGNFEVWRWEPVGTTQVSGTTGADANGDDLSVSGDGEQLVWTTRAVNGAGAATTTSRLLYDRYGTKQQIQIAAAGDLDLYQPSAGRTQSTLAFQADESLGDGPGGMNQDLNQEVWRWEAPYLEPLVTSPITSQPALANDVSGSPSSNARTTVVAFESTAPGLTGQNTAVPSVVRWAQTGGSTVLEPAWDGTPQPSTSAIGNVTTYIGADDGPGGDGSTDVFVSRCRTFSDVGLTHPFWEDVEWAAAELITTGYDDGTYRPSAPVTRAAMAAFMYRVLDPLDPAPDTTPSFPDVGPGHPFYEEIELLADQGVLGGYDDGTFRPSAPVTRQSMAAFLFRLAGEPDGPFPDPGFADVSESHPFAEAIAWMAAAGVSEGYEDGTFRPATNVSRQAMSAFLRRFTETELGAT